MDVRTDLRSCFDSQQRAFSRGVPDYAARTAALRALERALTRRAGELCRAVSDDFGGRAPEETLALEVFPVVNEVRYALRRLKAWMKPRRAPVPWTFRPARAWVRYGPLGVAGIISAWNYPVFLSCGPLVGALAAGNHAMLKPSELAPATAGLLHRIVRDLYPPEYVLVVPGDATVAAEFASLPFGRLLFTGSAGVARLVARAASDSLTPLTLELGGKSPAIVHPEYPADTAAARIMLGKLYNAGQTCVAPDYAFVHQNVVREFTAACLAAASRLYPAPSVNPNYTRIINAAHYARLCELIDDAARLGGNVLQAPAGGAAADVGGRMFPPTVVTDVSEDMRIAREEIFGPVLPVLTYSTVDEAFAYVSARPHPLALYYFDQDGLRARELTSRVQAGGVSVNDCVFHVGVPSLPFGGVGPSGSGQYHGFDGFETFSKKQGVFEQSRWPPQAVLRPPYGERARRILRWLLR